MLCAKNLVPDEALYGEDLIRGQNEEERTGARYRVSDLLESKLGAAILSGVANT
ncbi:Small subunit processome complex component [Orobanche hederae]